MKDPKRIDKVLNILKRYWKANPDLRLGQIIVSATPINYNGDPFYVEDESIIDNLPY